MESEFTWFYTTNMHKSISNLIKLKIQEYVLHNDFDSIYQMYIRDLFNCLNKKDLVSVFNHEEINLISFLLDPINDLSEYEGFYDGLLINGIDNEIIDYMGTSIMRILPNYSFKEYEDPFFILGLFAYLNKEQVKMILEDPKIDYLELLISQLYAWEDSNYGKVYIKEMFKKLGINFKEVIYPYLLNKDFKVYLKIIDYWLWELFELEEIKSIIKDKKINFLENLLLAYHKLAVKEISYEGFEFGFDYHIFPQDFMKNELEFLKVEIKKVIMHKNMELIYEHCTI